MQVRQAREQYVRWLATRDLSPHTIRAYESDIASLERYVGVHADVRDLNRDCVVSFVEDQRAASLSPRSCDAERPGCAASADGWCRTSF